MKKRDKKVKKKRCFLLVFTLLLVLLILAGTVSFFTEHRSQVISGLPSEYGTKKLTDKDMKKYVDKKVDASQVTMEVYPEVSVGVDGVNGNLWIRNAPVNKVGQQAVLLDEHSNELSKTGLIRPGYQVDTIKMNQKLARGVHKGVIRIIFYDLEKSIEVGQESVEVMIKVM